MNLKLGGRSLVTKHFGLHLNSQGAGEIRVLPVLIDFPYSNMELLLLFSIISPGSALTRSQAVFLNVK